MRQRRRRQLLDAVLGALPDTFPRAAAEGPALAEARKRLADEAATL